MCKDPDPAGQIDPRQNKIRLRFEPIHEPSLRISVILGDCLHNTRSTLDCLWRRLGGEGNFPMFCDRDGDKNWRSQRAKRLKGIGVDAHAIIDELQPCCAGKHAPAHPLAKNPVVEPLIPVTT